MNAVTTGPRHTVGTPVGWTRLIPTWRRSADEARGDRLVTASVGLVSAVMGAAAALFARGTTAAVWFGLVTLSVLVARLKAFPYWQVWYENDQPVIFRALPRGRAR